MTGCHQHHARVDLCLSCGPFVADDHRRIDVATVERGRRIGKLFATACRELGDDVQLTLGYDAVAAALGFANWSRLVRHGAPAERTWSDASCRAGVLRALPDIDTAALEGALDRIHAVFGRR